MELIDKAALVAEIKRLKSIKLSIFSRGETEEDCYNALSCISVYNEILSLIDTLEAKEVDLNKENKNLKMLLDVIDYSFLQTDGSYDKSLTYPVIDKVLFIKKNII